MTDTQVMAALEPFAKLADVILSEAPAEADDIVLFTDCQRRPHAISMDQLRAASVALASSSPAEPVAWAYGPQGDPPTWFASTRWKASDIGKWTETPLYAAPVPPPAGEADLCDQCGEYAHDCGGHPIVDSGDADEAYEIGKRDGYEAAIADVDRLTGGDGEYFASTIPGRGCPDWQTMMVNIVERFESATPAAGDAELRKALEKIDKALWSVSGKRPKRDPQAFVELADEIEDIVTKARATHPSVPVQQGWLPIETAPKTGEPVLIWKPDERMVGEYMMVAYWSDDHLVGEPGWIPVGGVHKQGYTSSVTGTDQGYPTHWRPLPATPPAQDQKGEDCRG